MSKITIVSYPDLDKSQYGSITGTIFMEIDDLCFPEKDWSDFPITILNWWIENLYKLKYSKDAEFAFMDGPYYIKATKESDLKIKIEGFERRISREVQVFTKEIETRRLKRTIFRNANKLLQIASNNGWALEDVVVDLKNCIEKYSSVT